MSWEVDALKENIEILKNSYVDAMEELHKELDLQLQPEPIQNDKHGRIKPRLITPTPRKERAERSVAR